VACDRSGEAKDEVLRITGRIADLAEVAAGSARRVAVNARRHLVRNPDQAKAGRLRQMINDLSDLNDLIGITDRVVDHARSRVEGAMASGATRIVSLHEPDARPIRKGRLGPPVEFGYQAQVADTTTASCWTTPLKPTTHPTPTRSSPPSSESNNRLIDPH